MYVCFFLFKNVTATFFHLKFCCCFVVVVFVVVFFIIVLLLLFLVYMCVLAYSART